jgi:hypothetical protein
MGCAGFVSVPPLLSLSLCVYFLPPPQCLLVELWGGGEGVPPSLGLLALWEVKGTLLETTCNSTA